VGFNLVLFSGFALFSASLAVISALKVHSFCVLCASTYGINLLLFILAVVQATSLGLHDALASTWQAVRERPIKILVIMIVLAAVAGSLMAFTPAYWRMSSHEQKWMDLQGLNRGITPDSGHFIGAANPEITVTEFSDYQCPGCKSAHAELRNIVKMFPQRVRVVHRHFPLDQSCNRSIDRPFHSDACRVATIAECAGRVGRFWEANDFLFGHALELDSLSTKAIASELGLNPAALATCMQGEGMSAVKTDIETGIALNLRGTPSFLVDGQLYFGNLPASVLERLQTK
jgi:protein-disulfide isomerase